MKATKKPSKRKSLVKKLDVLFSLYIRARDGYCVTCGSVEAPTNGHLFTSMAYSTRWDEENCWQQCWGCNYKHEFDPYPFTEFVRRKLGQKKYDALHLRYSTPRKYKDFELQELVEHYKNVLDKRQALE